MQLDSDQYPDITVDALRDLLEKKTEVFLIDVREPIERAMFNIGGSLIPLNTLPEQLGQLPSDKNQHIVAYCRSGMRSDTAKRLLISHGYTNVQNLLGGMLAWQAESFK